jgi:hypothetical protein
MVNMNRLFNKVARHRRWIATALGAAGARVAVNYSSDQEGAKRVAQAITDKKKASKLFARPGVPQQPTAAGVGLLSA